MSWSLKASEVNDVCDLCPGRCVSDNNEVPRSDGRYGQEDEDGEEWCARARERNLAVLKGLYITPP